MEKFICYDLAIKLIEELCSPVAKIRARDRSLVDQLQRAATSVALNLGEGRKRDGKDRIHLFRCAAGSAAELKAGLEVAVAWRWLSASEVSNALALVDQILAICWRLVHPIPSKHSRP